MAQSLINVLKIFLPIIISGNVFTSACSPISISSVTHSSSNAPVYEHPRGSDRPVSDVVRLHDAIIDDDRSQIIDIFIINNLYNRPFLHEEHLNTYGSDLKSLCQSELSGDFGHLITSLATPPWFFIARELHHAFSELYHRDYSIFDEILPYHDIEAIKEAYQTEYGVELTKRFRKLPYYVRQQFNDKIYGTHHSSSSRLIDSEDRYYGMKLKEAARQRDTRHFTRLIVLTLNDGILDEVRMSYRSTYGKPLASLVDELPFGDYREAISAILSPSSPYGDDTLPNHWITKVITSYSVRR